jgi:uncharacterized damage-inducible protein DinB
MSGCDASITFAELLDYTNRETARWREWFSAHTEALDQACDVAKAGTVRELLLHIFATELFFAHPVLDLPPVDWKNLRPETLDDLFGLGDDARRKMEQFISQATSTDWNEVKDLGLGSLKASKRKMIAQALLHGVHHRAHLATWCRQQGFDGMWVHDLILTDVMV